MVQSKEELLACNVWVWMPHEANKSRMCACNCIVVQVQAWYLCKCTCVRSWLYASTMCVCLYVYCVHAACETYTFGIAPFPLRTCMRGVRYNFHMIFIRFVYDLYMIRIWFVYDFLMIREWWFCPLKTWADKQSLCRIAIHAAHTGTLVYIYVVVFK